MKKKLEGDVKFCSVDIYPILAIIDTNNILDI